MPGGAEIEFTPATAGTLIAAWKDPLFKARCEIDYTEFFRANYRRVVALSKASAARPGG